MMFCRPEMAGTRAALTPSIIGVPTDHTSPVVGMSLPEISFDSVDFPEPFRPTMPSDSPRPTTSESSCSARMDTRGWRLTRP